MTPLKITLIITTVAAGLAIALILHRNAGVKLRENDTELQRQDRQLKERIAEQRSLSNQLAEATSSSISQEDELAKLRDRAQALQRQTNALGDHLQSHRQARASQPTEKPEPRPSEYWDQLHRLAGAKGREARDLSQAFHTFALDHQGRFPTNFEQIESYLRKAKMELSGTNQFEIVYHGSVEGLKGVPGGAVALIRDRQTWIAPSGKRARVYGLANGSSRIVESDDDFKAWEAEHIVSSAPGGQ